MISLDRMVHSAGSKLLEVDLVSLIKTYPVYLPSLETTTAPIESPVNESGQNAAGMVAVAAYL